jgi:hypothetical protein
VRAVGINVKSGQLFIAVADPSAHSEEALAVPVGGTSSRLQVNNGLDNAHRVADLLGRVRRDLGPLDAQRVGVVATRLYDGWNYASAYARITAISAVMLASVELDMSYEEVTTERISRIVRVPAHQLQTTPYTLFGWSSAPTYWTTGLAEAYGATAALLRSEGR